LRGGGEKYTDNLMMKLVFLGKVWGRRREGID